MPEKQYLDYEGLQRYHNKLKLNTNVGGSSTQGQIGDIIFPARSDTFDQIPQNYIPAAGQILYAADYPELAEVIGPMPAGYRTSLYADSSKVANLPPSPMYFLQTETGRIICCGYSSSRYSIWYSDDNGLSFTKAFEVSAMILGIFQSKIANRLVFLTVTAAYFSYDDGLTWESHSSGIIYNPCVQDNIGRLFFIRDGNGVIYCSEDDGITWNILATIVHKQTSGLHTNLNVLSNGNLIAQGSNASNSKYSVKIYISEDDGQTWNDGPYISEDASTSNVAIIEFDGGLVVFLGNTGTFMSSDYGITIGKVSTYGVNRGYFGIRSGPRSIYSYGYVSNDYGASFIPSEISGYVTQYGILLSNRSIITVRNQSAWYYSEPDPTIFLVPNVPGGYIRYK